MRIEWLSIVISISTYSIGYGWQSALALAPCRVASRFAEQRLHHREFTLYSRVILPPKPLTHLSLNTHSKGDSAVTETEDVIDAKASLNDVLADEEAVTNSSSEKETASTVDISLLGIPLRSVILLNLVAIIWGTQHSVIKTVVDDSALLSINFGVTNWAKQAIGTNLEQLVSNLPTFNAMNDLRGSKDDAAAYFTLARFSLAALLASPYTPGLMQQTTTDENSGEIQANGVDREETMKAWKYGIELGIYMFLGYAFQAIGLETTTASRSAFLLYLNVKLVPFFSFFLFGKTIQASTWISALVAFTGTALLAFDNASTGEGGLVDASFAVGDLWSIAAAAASALFILRMETASKAVPKSAELNAANLWTVALLSLLWTAWISYNNLQNDPTLLSQNLPNTVTVTLQQTFLNTVNTITTNPLQLIYLSTVTTAIANYLQSIAQKEVSAERASIFYALDPVYGAAFANVILGETLGLWGWVGASLIAFAAATNAIWDFSSTTTSTDSNENTTNKTPTQY